MGVALLHHCVFNSILMLILYTTLPLLLCPIWTNAASYGWSQFRSTIFKLIIVPYLQYDRLSSYSLPDTIKRRLCISDLAILWFMNVRSICHPSGHLVKLLLFILKFLKVSHQVAQSKSTQLNNHRYISSYLSVCVNCLSLVVFRKTFTTQNACIPDKAVDISRYTYLHCTGINSFNLGTAFRQPVQPSVQVEKSRHEVVGTVLH